MAVKTCGLLDPSRYRLLEGVVSGIVVEHVVTVIGSAAVTAFFSEALHLLLSLNAVIEVHALYDGSKRAEALIGDLAATVGERAAIHVIPLSEDVEDRAYRVVERIRGKAPYSYLYGDTSYTFTHTVCPACGQVVVKRHEWGVHIAGRVSADGFLRCAGCGRRQPIIVCSGSRKPRALHREVVVW